MNPNDFDAAINAGRVMAKHLILCSKCLKKQNCSNHYNSDTSCYIEDSPMGRAAYRYKENEDSDI